MPRHKDYSPHCRDWSTRKLLAEIRKAANMDRFDPGTFDGATMPRTGDAIREATRLYRDTWLNPRLDELARRLKLDTNGEA